MTTTYTGIAAAVAEREAAVKKAMPFVIRYERDATDTDAEGRAVCREAGDLVSYYTEANPKPDNKLGLRLARAGYSVRSDFPPRTLNRDEALEALNLALESLESLESKESLIALQEERNSFHESSLESLESLSLDSLFALQKRKEKIRFLLFAYKDLTDDDDETCNNESRMGSASWEIKRASEKIVEAVLEAIYQTDRIDHCLSVLAELSDKKKGETP